MKIVIAMDSFKGSLTSMEAGNAVKAGIEKVCDAEIVVKPIADGGEGTTEALVSGLGGEKVTVEVTDPLGRKIQALYGILPDGTAVMEMAQAAGITLIKKRKRCPFCYNIWRRRDDSRCGTTWLPEIPHRNRWERNKRRWCWDAAGVGIPIFGCGWEANPCRSETFG